MVTVTHTFRAAFPPLSLVPTDYLPRILVSGSASAENQAMTMILSKLRLDVLMTHCRATSWDHASRKTCICRSPRVSISPSPLHTAEEEDIVKSGVGPEQRGIKVEVC